jgi:hypothetical protein
MSAEHVIPHALAGISERNPFLLRTVCTRCNNKCGRHVDAPFLRSWGIQASIEQIRSRYTLVTVDTTLPLAYMGELHDTRHEARICDVWLGPAGDRIYHFHQRYEQDEDARVAVGVPQWGPKRRFDPGFVFVLIHTDREPWPEVAVRSCFAEFPDSSFYLVNGPPRSCRISGASGSPMCRRS